MAGLTFKTNNQVRTLKATGKRYEAYRATSERGKGRLGVEVSNTGTKRWFYRYFLSGTRKYIRLGLVTDEFTMTIAQKECDKFAQMLAQDTDPKLVLEEQKQAMNKAKQEEAMKGSVQQLFESYTEQMKNDGKRTFEAVLTALEKEAYPIIGPTTKAKDVQPTDVVNVLSRMIQRGAAVQSNRVRSYLVAAFNYGLKHDLNPAQHHTGVKFGLFMNPAQVVPKQSSAEKAGDNWLSLREVQELLGNFETVPKVGKNMAALMKLCFFTGGQRPYELVASRWDSVEWRDRTLLVSSDISKNKKEHLIPLTENALSVLNELFDKRESSPFIFPKSNDEQQHLRTDSFSKAISRYREKYPDFNPFVARDIRRTCKTLMGELGISKEIRDRIQNHALNDVSSKHYDRYDYLPEKRNALIRWEQKLLRVKANILVLGNTHAS